MLGLRYVPSSHGSPLARNVAHHEIWVMLLHIQVLLGLAKFSHELSLYPWRTVGWEGTVESLRLEGELRFGPWFGITAYHLLMGSLAFLKF